jgi:hypothetical protein
MQRLRGSVYQRGSGKYTAVTEPQRAADGGKKRQSLGTFGTADEAERALATYNGTTHGDDPIHGLSDPTVADIAHRWKDKQRLRCDAGAIARLTSQGYDGIVVPIRFDRSRMRIPRSWQHLFAIPGSYHVNSFRSGSDTPHLSRITGIGLLALGHRLDSA